MSDISLVGQSLMMMELKSFLQILKALNSIWSLMSLNNT